MQLAELNTSVESPVQDFKLMLFKCLNDSTNLYKSILKILFSYYPHSSRICMKFTN